ncbi:MAG: RNA polymerase sigma factor [Vicinamibacterales bacterium]
MSEAEHDSGDEALVAAARGGDAAAFGRLLGAHLPGARRVAMAALGNTAEADEAVQEASVTAWRQIGTLADPRAFRPWLLRITWRKALDRRRTLVRWVRGLVTPAREGDGLDPLDRVAAADQGAEARLVAEERDVVIARAVRSLPDRLRQPFLLAAAGEQSYTEIAAMLDIPLGTLKWRVSEARRVLKEKLARMGVEDAR